MSAWWSQANNANYTRTIGQNIQGTPRDRFIQIAPWLPAEKMAYVCDQMVPCMGFVMRIDGGSPVSGKEIGGWWIMGGGATTSVTDSRYMSYVKNAAARSVDENKPNEPSVLDAPLTKVSLFDGGNFDGTEWKVGKGLYSVCYLESGGQIPWDNKPASARIPLGYKMIGFQNCFDSYDSRIGTGAYIDGVGPKDLSVADFNVVGMVDQMSSLIVEQVPFDIEANWNRMAAGFIHPTDELLIKANFCRTLSASRLAGDKKSDCKTVLGNSEYNHVLVNKCVADTTSGWIDNKSILDILKQAFRSNTDAEGVNDLFLYFCRGDPTNSKSLGGHRTDPRCACINASDFGMTGTSNCFNDNIKNFPGCVTGNFYGSTVPRIGIVDKLKDIVNYPDKQMVNNALVGFSADSGCLVEACTAATSDGPDLMLPATSATCRNVNLQFCGINIDIGAAQDSPISATCQQTMTVNPPPGSPPPTNTQSAGAAPSGSTPPGSAAAGGGTPPRSSSNMGLIIGVVVVVILIILMAGIALTSGGPEMANENYNYPGY